MRLKKSKTAAEEELTALVNDGFSVLNWIREDYAEKRKNAVFDTKEDNNLYKNKVDEWGDKVIVALNGIFPTELESNMFINAPSEFGTVSSEHDYKWSCLTKRIPEFIRTLDKIIEAYLLRYTDLPIQARLYVEDIDSFRKVRDVNPSTITNFLINGKYLDVSEDFIQVALEQILNVSFHKKDWGGETNDLYTANVIVNGSRTATAFLLKGNGLKKDTFEIRDCGKNGDQLLRLFNSPAELFIIQFVGNISEAIIKDVEGKVNELRLQSKRAWFCIMDGQDTARVLHAYGKL